MDGRQVTGAVYRMFGIILNAIMINFIKCLRKSIKTITSKVEDFLVLSMEVGDHWKAISNVNKPSPFYHSMRYLRTPREVASLYVLNFFFDFSYTNP